MNNVDCVACVSVFGLHLTGLFPFFLCRSNDISATDLATDIKVEGLLQRTTTGGLPDPFALVYVDDEIRWESEARYRTPTPHWQVDLRL